MRRLLVEAVWLLGAAVMLALPVAFLFITDGRS